MSSRIIAAAVAVAAGLALAVGGAATLVSLARPDRGIDLQNAPAGNGVDGGVVDYGTK
ncbi:hypothetical protein [Actinophytocola algeriensis]|uniref:DUF2613 family protein n=1 Tax=Actinophytocola algeriensis TaxID=1768010 RepID=A0A7W7VHV6_9PSEU|nr:hypothetical protein [Actinophytocola algeriensis]MBB4910816.1 hypothetical protein [Actinophytocola algeriensis]MBE1473809.1 hypothetical protein [Actinophytocola algeriensis]